MKDIELPPLPESCQNGNQTTDYFGKLFEYTRLDMRSYARAAVEADRAQRAPDGWKLVPIEPTDAMVQQSMHLDLSYMPGHEGPDRVAVYRAMLSAVPLLASTPAPAQQERKPMTDEVVREGFAACGVGGINARLGFVEGVKFAERHHGIRE